MTAQFLLLNPSIQTLPQADSLPLQLGRARNLFATYSLQWRSQVLWVSLAESADISNPIPQQYLVACLERSEVRHVCIDPAVGEDHLKAWAKACHQAGKALFLRVPKGNTPDRHSPLAWRCKRGLDWLAALAAVIALSPVLVPVACLIKLDSPGPIFYRQWRVGHRGKFFQVWKFRTMVANAEALHHKVMGQQAGLHKQENDPRITPLGRWLRKYSVDEFPQLINVLRGEMSMVGPRPWALYDALQIPQNGQERLRATPGMTGEWQVAGRSNLRDIGEVTQCDLNYLRGWSIARDLKLLLRTIPKVLRGTGAC